MFRQRLLTALILAPLVLGTIYYANFWVLVSLILILVMACGHEWLQLIPIHDFVCKVVLLTFLLFASLLIHYAYEYWLFLGLLVWILMVLAIVYYPSSQRYWGNRLTVSVLCLLLLPLFAQSLINIYEMENGRAYIIYLLFLVWAADIGAYVAGKLLGKRRLIPKVSPGKTVEGFCGGAILCLIVAYGGYRYFQPQVILLWIVFTLLIFLMSLIGDLLISLLKRRTQIKDTGHVLPGHGGILDRLDSLIAAAPMANLGLHLIVMGTIRWF